MSKSNQSEIQKLPKVIPPKTVVHLVRGTKANPLPPRLEQRLFRIGYYSKQDGLDTIWLVKADGKYNGTVDREYLLRHYKIVKLSKETDLYGLAKPQFRRLNMSLWRKRIKITN